MNIGVDFGTTYSTFAEYDKTTNTVSEVDFGESEKSCIPSIVSYDKKLGKYRYGSMARDQMFHNSGNCVFYRAFKMLLPERNKELLESRGYVGTTPAEVSKKFLKNFLNMAKGDGEEKFNKMVVCVPEVWNGSSNTLDGRNNLRKLCEELDITKKLQIVTEPEAASAYFVYNYERFNNKPFSGYVLTVDYGGGTLDITLMKARTVKGNGKNITQLQSLARSGRGENHEKEIGSAGIAFMEEVVATALREAGFLKEGEKPIKDPEFFKAVDCCEKALMLLDNQNELKILFGSKNYDYAKILNDADIRDALLDIFFYGGKDVNITYGHLVKAYQKVIYPVLDDGLNQIIALAKALGNEQIDLLNPKERENILYASVGGFGKFVLVEQQVYSKLKYTVAEQSKNNRIKSKKESAVALGAALVANDVITIQSVAAHSLGVYAQRFARKQNVRQNVVNYAIKFGQPIEYGKKYYACSKNDPSNLTGYSIGSNALNSFLIGYNTNYSAGYPMPIKEELSQKLKNLPKERVAVGFSQDEDSAIWIHLHPIDDNNKLLGEYSLDIQLSTFDELFDTVETHIIHDGEEVRL